ncbi:DUF6314 family protein [Microbulbifer sp. Q7]|uniref:DUF6314 family protein n=1 Tax=Microbulbifer sp. Q7 TaxID=1785091 RepID=UPI000A72C97D|nr:DUF6314 family protein [Microbulbifer sp. Q7]
MFPLNSLVDYKALTALAQLVARLQKVRAFSFTASNGPGSKTNWRGHGRGDVTVTSCGAHTLFAERAEFTDADGHKIDLQNTYRWTRCPAVVRLEHLRRAQPVLLFNLAPMTEHGFRHQAPHLCGEDTYTADLILHADEIELIWQIHGPRKNERLHYHYW